MGTTLAGEVLRCFVPQSAYERLKRVCVQALPKKPKKHPKDMSDDEALKHLFHPKIVRAVKKHLSKAESRNDARNKNVHKPE